MGKRSLLERVICFGGDDWDGWCIGITSRYGWGGVLRRLLISRYRNIRPGFTCRLGISRLVDTTNMALFYRRKWLFFPL